MKSILLAIIIAVATTIAFCDNPQKSTKDNYFGPTAFACESYGNETFIRLQEEVFVRGESYIALVGWSSAGFPSSFSTATTTLTAQPGYNGRIFTVYQVNYTSWDEMTTHCAPDVPCTDCPPAPSTWLPLKNITISNNLAVWDSTTQFLNAKNNGLPGVSFLLAFAEFPNGFGLAYFYSREANNGKEPKTAYA